MLAVSTTWNHGRHAALCPAVRELAALGYEAVELRARGAAPDREEAGRLCRDLRIRCRSVHAPLTAGPWTDGDPSRDLASLDEARRARAVASVLGTLPAAAEARAEVIVLHLGEVEVERARERQEAWLAAVTAGDPLPGDREAARAERAALRDRHLAAAARSLFELTRAEPEVTFALENRLHFHEIPDLEEVELLLEDAAGKRVAYWHDTGHAHLLGRVGGPDPAAWLARHGPRCAGLHLHDVVGGVDHLPPGGGEVEWAAVREGISSRMLRVLEVHARHSAEELAAGASFARGL